MNIFPLGRHRIGALSGGLGCVLGFSIAHLLASVYPDVSGSHLLFALIMFLASYFFISVGASILTAIDARIARSGKASDEPF